MTKYTAVYKLPSPDLVESADGPLGFSNLANATETALVQLRKGLNVARYRVSDFAIGSGTTLLSITLDGLEVSNGFTWASPHNWPIIPVDGFYLAIATVIFANQAGGIRQAAITKDGTVIPAGVTNESYATADRYVTCNVSYAGYFAADQVIGLQIAQSSGKSLTCTTARLGVNLLAYK